MGITIHEALAEIKLLDKRINDKTNKSVFIGITKGREGTVNASPKEEFEKKAKADLQSVKDLIQYRADIKKAIILSNAETTVLIGGTSYKVAEAIDMKNAINEYKTNLINELTFQLEETSNTVKSFNERLDKEATDYAKQLYGQKENVTPTAEVEGAIKGYKEIRVYEAVDPNGLQEIIEQLSAELDNFITEVDAKLSISNAITMIEIDKK